MDYKKEESLISVDAAIPESEKTVFVLKHYGRTASLIVVDDPCKPSDGRNAVELAAFCLGAKKPEIEIEWVGYDPKKGIL